MALKNPYEILRRPVLTEKTTRSMEHQNAYVFEVSPEANKIQIRDAVRERFDVKVLKVNTRWRKGKWRRRGRSIGKTSPVKEAVVTLQKGDKIDVY